MGRHPREENHHFQSRGCKELKKYRGKKSLTTAVLFHYTPERLWHSPLTRKKFLKLHWIKKKKTVQQFFLDIFIEKWGNFFYRGRRNVSQVRIKETFNGHKNWMRNRPVKQRKFFFFSGKNQTNISSGAASFPLLRIPNIFHFILFLLKNPLCATLWWEENGGVTHTHANLHTVHPLVFYRGRISFLKSSGRKSSRERIGTVFIEEERKGRAYDTRWLGWFSLVIF